MASNIDEERPQRIVIFGAGQGADLARRCFEWDTPHEIVGHLVDRDHLTTSTFKDRPVVAIEDSVCAFPPAEVLAFVPLGSSRMNALRVEKYALLKSMGYGFVSYVHSSNRVSGRCTIGENCLILENQSVNFDVVIGNNVVIWSGCQVGDRSRIGDHVFMAAHVVINGDVEIGERSYLGSNCNISNAVRVAPLSFIGANALITANTKEGSVYVVEQTPAIEMDSLRFSRLIPDFM